MSLTTVDTNTDANLGLQVVHISDDAWDAFVDQHVQGHLLQTSSWATLKAQYGWSRYRVVLSDGSGDPVVGASVLQRSAYGFRIAYVPRGPLTDWADSQVTQTLLDAVKTACRKRGAAILKLEPGLPDTMSTRLMLERYGFSPSPQTVQPQSTVVVEIDSEDAVILRRMKSKWRYNIRLSARRDVQVRVAEHNDLTAFNEMMSTTSDRDGFSVHSAEYYRTAFELLAPDRAAYLMAEYGGNPLAAIVVALTGETACYLWGASSNLERNRMPNHALQWAAMQWAKERGAKHFDLWGIPDDIGLIAKGIAGAEDGRVQADTLPVELAAMPRENLWGVFRFKQGFGGYVVRDVGAWDMPLGAYGKQLYRTGLGLRDRANQLRIHVRRLQNSSVEFEPPSTQSGSVANASEWQDTLKQLPSPHVLQSWEWGEIKAQTGWRADRQVVRDDDGNAVAAFQFLWRELSGGLPFRIGYVPKGPIVDWKHGLTVDVLLDAIESYARQSNCIFVKIDPDVRSDRADGVVLTSKLKRRGWRFSGEQIQFQNTAYSDLRRDEDALLASMKSKWRYNIRLATRRGIVIHEGTTDDLSAFYDMYAETGARDGFLVRPSAYYANAWKKILGAQSDDTNPAGGALLLAEHADEEQPVAGLFLMKYADRAWYFYGASTDKRRRDMPNHLLQWEAMRWARGQHCAVYDWWGAPTNPADANDAMQGVWKFKQGFSVEFQPHIGAWDYVTNRALYSLYSEAIPRVLDIMKRRSANDDVDSDNDM